MMPDSERELAAPRPLYTAPPAADQVEADLKNLRFRISGREIIAGATLICVIVIAVFLWQHMGQADKALGELSGTMRELTGAIRERTCLERFPEAERARQVDFCKSIAR